MNRQSKFDAFVFLIHSAILSFHWSIWSIYIWSNYWWVCLYWHFLGGRGGGFTTLLFLSSFAHFPCDLMMVFSVTCGFLSLFFCVSIIDFWIVVTLRFVYNNIIVCVCVRACVWWQSWDDDLFKFECILTSLQFYPAHFNFSYIIFYFYFFGFMGSLTSHYRYSWVDNFCLLIFLLAL